MQGYYYYCYKYLGLYGKVLCVCMCGSHTNKMVRARVCLSRITEFTDSVCVMISVLCMLW